MGPNGLLRRLFKQPKHICKVWLLGECSTNLTRGSQKGRGHLGWLFGKIWIFDPFISGLDTSTCSTPSLVLHDIALYRMVLHCIIWYLMVFHCIARYCISRDIYLLYRGFSRHMVMLVTIAPILILWAGCLLWVVGWGTTSCCVSSFRPPSPSATALDEAKTSLVRPADARGGSSWGRPSCWCPAEAEGRLRPIRVTRGGGVSGAQTTVGFHSFLLPIGGCRPFRGGGASG